MIVVESRAARRLSALEWGLGAVVISLALTAWLTTRHPFRGGLDAYGIFPLFGLIAFSVMWTHYIMWAGRNIIGVKSSRQTLYSMLSSYLVLALIIAHPLTLIVSLWLDGLGLPPASYLQAYPGHELAFVCAIVGLSLFLAYELHRWFRKRSWWHWVLDAQLIAMVAIFYHSLTLGQELAQDWFRAVWWVYGITLIAAAMYNYIYDIKNKTRGKHAKGE